MTENRMKWSTLLSRKRVGKDLPDIGPRSPFQMDIDRIIFLDHFRRLSRKAQVHPLIENDHIHSRLTHSLETSSVGRSLGELAGFHLQKIGELPPDIEPHHLGQIVQAACLAHDIGNPPFGHSGESAIKDWFNHNASCIDYLDKHCRTDFTKFDGNAMSLRILLSTGFHSQGIGPTYPLIGALLKYPWPSSFDSGKEKFSYFYNESTIINTICEELGLIKQDNHFCRHPLAFLMEAADDICYRIIDLEDATEVGILDKSFMYDKFIDLLEYPPEKAEGIKSLHFRQRNSIIRAKLINTSISECFDTFIKNYDLILQGKLPPDTSLLSAAGGKTCKALASIYKGISNTLFLSRRKMMLEIGAFNAIGKILEVCMLDIKHICTGDSSYNKDKIKALLGSDVVEKNLLDHNKHYLLSLAVLDYISGMSDHYATEVCRKFLGLGF